jgi:hypothetical protein
MQKNPYHQFHFFGAVFVTVLAEGFYDQRLLRVGYFLTSFIAVWIQGIPLPFFFYHGPTQRVITHIERP